MKDVIEKVRYLEFFSQETFDKGYDPTPIFKDNFSPNKLIFM